MESNKRTTNRQRVLKGGRIVSGDKGTMDVTIRDLSETGAKLLCASPLAVPNEFRLVLPGDGTIRNVKVVWRKEGSLGVTFVGEAKQSILRKT